MKMVDEKAQEDARFGAMRGGGGGMGGGGGGGGGGFGGEEVMLIQVPNNCVGGIIGRGGETIRRIQDDSGCNVQASTRPSVQALTGAGCGLSCTS